MNGKRSLGDVVAHARLISRLGDMFDAVDPVPDAVLAAARGALAWRDFDGQLARLLEEESSLVRGRGEQRLVTFEASGLTVVLESTDIGVSRRLVGQLVPSGPQLVTVESAGIEGGSVQVPVDHLGRFTVASVPPGPTRLRTGLADGTHVVTEWTTI
jgi:hypothetical protein